MSLVGENKEVGIEWEGQIGEMFGRVGQEQVSVEWESWTGEMSRGG